MSRGGARAGAGRPRKKPKAEPMKPDPTTSIPLDAENLTPLEFMLSIMRNPKEDPARRDKMAQAAAPYVHPKAGEKGKKEAKAEAAKTASTGKFAPARPPGTVLPFPGRNNPQ